jgi:hypothetical protein
VSTNLDEMLGLPKNGAGEFVAYEVSFGFSLSQFNSLTDRSTSLQRDPFEFGSRAIAVSTIDGKQVEIIA